MVMIMMLMTWRECDIVWVILFYTILSIHNMKRETETGRERERERERERLTYNM